VLLASGAHAECVPLPSMTLWPIDRLAEGYPDRGVRVAEEQIKQLPVARDPLIEAQLYAVIAAARAQQGRSQDARNAAVEARRLLDRSGDSPAARRVRDRVAISDGADAETERDLLTAIASNSQVIERAPSGSPEQICALAARADVHAERLELDLAAADGLTAYQLAENSGLAEPRIQAAAILANIYRRAGLLPEAERMIDEVVQFERAEQVPAQLAGAIYVRGQILIERHQYDAARKALEESRSLAEQSGDHFGAVFTDVALCPALISAGALDAAQQVCSAGDSEFTAAGRGDLTTLMLGYRARLDLARGQPEAALAKLDEVLGSRAADIMPPEAPKLHLDRAQAYGTLGLFANAYKELAHSRELQEALDTTRRAQAAAVLKVTADSARRGAASRRLMQKLWIAVALSATMVSVLFAGLLWTTRRHKNRLSRQQAVLKTVTSNAPDTLMLIEAGRIVRFANRSLFGVGPTPEAGELIDDVVPPGVRQTLRDAIDDVFARAKINTFTTAVVDAAGIVRHFELRCVPVVENGVLVAATLRSIDVTEVRRLEREVLDVATSERMRLCSDMHEGLGQELTGISLLLTGLATRIDRGRAARLGEVREILEHVTRTIELTRQIAHGLSPLRSHRGSLRAALSRLAVESSRRLHLAVGFKSECGDPPTSEFAADHLYRIVLEAITNAARHSGCTAIDICLTMNQEVLRILVSDDGSGLPASDDRADGLGLKMMTYRARLLGGTVSLEPGADRGARLVVMVRIDKIGERMIERINPAAAGAQFHWPDKPESTVAEAEASRASRRSP